MSLDPLSGLSEWICHFFQLCHIFQQLSSELLPLLFTLKEKEQLQNLMETVVMMFDFEEVNNCVGTQL